MLLIDSMLFSLLAIYIFAIKGPFKYFAFAAFMAIISFLGSHYGPLPDDPQYKYVLYSDGKEITTCHEKTKNGFANCNNGMSYENMGFVFKRIEVKN